MTAKPDMAGFASKAELEQYRRAREGFLLGRIHADHGVNFEASISDERHIFIVAGSRAGKGTSMILPNLLAWKGGVFAIDPKGESASISAMRRGPQEGAKGTGTAVRPPHFMEQRVAILDPLGTVRGPARKYRISYNPLNDIDTQSDSCAAQILGIAEANVISETSADSHFTESAVTILAGLIEAVVQKERDPQKRTLTHCRSIALRGIDSIKDYLEDAPSTPAALADEAFGLLLSVGEDEGGSFLSTLSRQLKWIADPRMQTHLSGGAFSLVQAIREQSTIYVCLPPARIPGMKRWLRTIVRIALEAKMDSPFEHSGQQTLFLLDEFYALGHFPLIEEAAAYMAGYGIKLAPVIQNIGQLKKLYGPNWETFLGNAGAVIGWGLNDHETEQYFSDRLGKTMQWEQSFSESRSPSVDGFTSTSKSRSENQALRERSVRWSNEIHFEGARRTMKAFIVTADGRPFIVERVNYMQNDGANMFDSPDHIKAWEEQNAAKAGLIPKARE